MSTKPDHNLTCKDKRIWIISEGRFLDVDLSGVAEGNITGPHREYNISDIGRYLLNSKPIEVKKKLIGCEVHYHQSTLNKIRKSLWKILPESLKTRKKNRFDVPEVIVSRFKVRIPPLNDPGLAANLGDIQDQLRFYDSVAGKLARLDAGKIFQIVGICEDIGGHYSYLKLQGSIEEKIKYLVNSVSKDVGVVLNKAYVADGLFELRGYDFISYDAARSYRLISYNADGGQKACVLADDNEIDFHLSDPHLIKYMHLLEQALKANPGLSKAVRLCVEGRAKATKLFFNKKLEIDYSTTRLPAIYQDVFNTLNVGRNQRNLIKPILNHLQIGVSLNYIPLVDLQEDRMLTHISVLHDFRALEPLRKNLPTVYSEMCKRAFFTEAGRFYLLDSIDGYSNA